MPKMDLKVHPIPASPSHPDNAAYVAAYHRHIEDKIRLVLSIYPRLSPSMLQVGLGPSLSARIWRPILAKLQSKGIVQSLSISRPTISGGLKHYTILQLTPQPQPTPERDHHGTQ